MVTPETSSWAMSAATCWPRISARRAGRTIMAAAAAPNTAAPAETTASWAIRMRETCPGVAPASASRARAPRRA